MAAAAVLWCALVAAVASLVWVVIDRAGQGVVPTSQAEAPRTGSVSSASPAQIEDDTLAASGQPPFGTCRTVGTDDRDGTARDQKLAQQHSAADGVGPT